MNNLKDFDLQNNETSYCLVPREIINTGRIHNNNDTEICLFVPKIMPLIDMKDKPYISEINNLNSDIIINDKEKFDLRFPEQVKVCNFIRADFLKLDNTQPSIIDLAERCSVRFLNNDVKLPRYTKERNQEEKRKRDIQHIKVPHVVKEDPTKKDYNLILDTINEKFELFINDDIHIRIDEASKTVKIQNKDSFIELTEDNVVSKKSGSEVVISDSGVDINSSELRINGETLEDIIRRIVASMIGGLIKNVK